MDGVGRHRGVPRGVGSGSGVTGAASFPGILLFCPPPLNFMYFFFCEICFLYAKYSKYTRRVDFLYIRVFDSGFFLGVDFFFGAFIFYFYIYFLVGFLVQFILVSGKTGLYGWSVACLWVNLFIFLLMTIL